MAVEMDASHVFVRNPGEDVLLELRPGGLAPEYVVRLTRSQAATLALMLALNPATAARPSSQLLAAAKSAVFVLLDGEHSLHKRPCTGCQALDDLRAAVHTAQAEA